MFRRCATAQARDRQTPPNAERQMLAAKWQTPWKERERIGKRERKLGKKKAEKRGECRENEERKEKKKKKSKIQKNENENRKKIKREDRKTENRWLFEREKGRRLEERRVEIKQGKEEAFLDKEKQP